MYHPKLNTKYTKQNGANPGIFRQLQTLKYCQDSCRLSRQMKAVADCQDICKDLETMSEKSVLVCSIRVSLSLMSGSRNKSIIIATG